MSEKPGEQAKRGRCHATTTITGTEYWCWRWKGHTGAHRGGNGFYGGHRASWPAEPETSQVATTETRASA